MDEDEYVRGSGNVFRDFGYPDADLRQAKVQTAVEIARVLDERGWAAHEAAFHTGASRVEFLRIRRPDLERFTLDRLLNILSLLGEDVVVSIEFKPGKPSTETITVHAAE